MKKTIAIILSLFVLIGSFCSCSSGNGATPDKATTANSSASADPSTPEGATRLYQDNAPVWEADDDEAFCYLFIDLDFDGILELVQSSKDNNSDKTTNKFFRIDTKIKSVVEIACSDEDAITRWDFAGGDYPQLYKNNSTGELKYMVYDNARENVGEGGMRIGEMTYSAEEGIKTRALWGFRYASADGSYDGNFTFTYASYDDDNNEKEISSDEYNSTLEAYENNNTNLSLRFKYIEKATTEYAYAELTNDAKHDLLLDAYNAFTYSK